MRETLENYSGHETIATEAYNRVADNLLYIYDTGGVLIDQRHFDLVTTVPDGELDAIVYQTSLRDQETPITAFLASNPEEVHPVKEVPDDVVPFRATGLFATLARNAPSLDSIAHLATHFQLILEKPEGSPLALDRYQSARQEIVYSLVLGSMQLFDSDNVAPTQAILQHVSEVVASVRNPGDMQDSLRRALSQMIIRGTDYASKRDRINYWDKETTADWDISNEALYGTAVLVTEVGLCSSFFAELAIASGRIHDDEILLAGLHESLLSEELRPILLRSFGDKPIALQSLAEAHIQKTLAHHANDPKRQQNKARALLNIVHGSYRSSSLSKLLMLAGPRIVEGGREDFGEDIGDFAFAGEAWLSLLTLTHNEEDEDERARQFAIDVRHAEIVGILMERVVELHKTSPREPLTFFDLLDRFPDIDDEEAGRLYYTYAIGKVATISGYARRKRRGAATDPFRIPGRFERGDGVPKGLFG